MISALGRNMYTQELRSAAGHGRHPTHLSWSVGADQTQTHKWVLLWKHCHGCSRNKGWLQGKKLPSAQGKSDRCFHVWAVSYPHAGSRRLPNQYGCSMGWMACPWSLSGLGQVPSPLVGHEVQEKDLEGFHSRLRQGQTHRCPGQIEMKAREIVHKSDGFTFSLLTSPP